MANKLQNPASKLRKIIGTLDAAYEALNQMGVDDDIRDLVMAQEPEEVDVDYGMDKDVEDAMQTLIKVLNPLEKLVGYSKPAAPEYGVPLRLKR